MSAIWLLSLSNVIRNLILLKSTCYESVLSMVSVPILNFPKSSIELRRYLSLS